MRFPVWIGRVAIAVFAAALLVSATAIGIAPRLWAIANAHEEVPVELPDFSAISQRSLAYDLEGKEIASYEIENSQPVPLADIPSDVVAAFLAVEDDGYFEHEGVNVRSLFRATLSNFAGGELSQGASTITMQVVKNDYLAGLERDGRYKLVQIAYAVRLEKQRTKNEILQRYLNTVFFGQNSYGIQAAAETYFGKPATELTQVEGAFLAGLVKAPSSYDPITRPEQSRARFNQVLDQLERFNLLSEAERTDIEQTFVLPERVRRREDTTIVRTHYSEAVRDYLLNRTDILGDTYEERYTRLHRGGLRIHTTIDPDLQAKAEKARTELPENRVGIDAALTTVENATGAVRAMVGGAPFVPGRNEVNLALAPSQTGSSIKLFVLATAIQAGAESQDLIDGTRGCQFQSPDSDEVYKLRSGLERDGVNDLKVQTANSVNCAYVRLFLIAGRNRVVDTVYRIAKSPYLYKGQPDRNADQELKNYLTFSTGANEMSTLDMASGLQTIANQGIHNEPYFVERIEDASGAIVYQHENDGERAMERNAALTTIDVLRAPPAFGTARRELSEMSRRRPIIGKTGTQDENTTAWFVGATPELTTAVLVRDPDGYTKMRGIREFREFGKVQGGTYPARIWKALMDQTGLETAGGDWPKPPKPARSPARLILPGNECVKQFVGYRSKTVTVTENVPGFAAGRGQGLSAPPPGTAPPPPTSAAPRTIRRKVTQREAVYKSVKVGTTVPPDVLDPNAPMPSVAIDKAVGPCN